MLIEAIYKKTWHLFDNISSRNNARLDDYFVFIIMHIN